MKELVLVNHPTVVADNKHYPNLDELVNCEYKLHSDLTSEDIEQIKINVVEYAKSIINDMKISFYRFSCNLIHTLF